MNNRIKPIIQAGLLAGTLDILAAIIIYGYILGNAAPDQILRYIASGALGREAFEGGLITAFYGLVFHYIIAFYFVTAYFLLFPYITFLRKYKLLSGTFYGIFVWLWMNLLVLPMSKITQQPFRWDSALTGIVILIVCIGWPVSLIAHRYYTSTQ